MGLKGKMRWKRFVQTSEACAILRIKTSEEMVRKVVVLMFKVNYYPCPIFHSHTLSTLHMVIYHILESMLKMFTKQDWQLGHKSSAKQIGSFFRQFNLKLVTLIEGL